jgi:hypothetical protein
MLPEDLQALAGPVDETARSGKGSAETDYSS